MTLLGLKLRQTQQLNQGLQQSLRVLQMSGLELEREVDDWLQDNPLLGRPEPAEDGRFEPTRLSAAVSSRNQIGGEDAEDGFTILSVSASRRIYETPNPSSREVCISCGMAYLSDVV